MDDPVRQRRKGGTRKVGAKTSVTCDRTEGLRDYASTRPSCLTLLARSTCATWSLYLHETSIASELSNQTMANDAKRKKLDEEMMALMDLKATYSAIATFDEARLKLILIALSKKSPELATRLRLLHSHPLMTGIDAFSDYEISCRPTNSTSSSQNFLDDPSSSASKRPRLESPMPQARDTDSAPTPLLGARGTASPPSQLFDDDVHDSTELPEDASRTVTEVIWQLESLVFGPND